MPASTSTACSPTSTRCSRGFAGATVLTNTFPDVAGVSPLLRRVAPKVAGVQRRDPGGGRAARRPRRRLRRARDGQRPADLEPGPHPRQPGRARADRGRVRRHRSGCPDSTAGSIPSRRPSRAAAVPAARAELRWVRTTVVPWAIRHARGRSSGDGITAKRPRSGPGGVAVPSGRPGVPGRAASTGRTPATGSSTTRSPTRSRPPPTGTTRTPRRWSRCRSTRCRWIARSASRTAFRTGTGRCRPSAVEAVHPLRRDGDGAWIFSAAGRASSDR